MSNENTKHSRKQGKTGKVGKRGCGLYYIVRSYTNLMNQKIKDLEKALYISTLDIV